MLFNSAIFLFAFLPIVVLGYYLLGWSRVRDLPSIFLVAASFFFYGWWAPELVLLLICSVLGNFGLGIAIDRFRGTPSEWPAFVLGIAGNLGLLGYFKYAGFFVRVVNDLSAAGFPVPELVLPLAISFFTFQQIAYLADVRAGQRAETRLLTYVLFVVFFPQLIAGPIVHHKEMIPQYADDPARRADLTLISLGLTVFAIGLFKKMLIADTAAVTASRVFDGVAAGTSVSFFEAWFGSLAYSFQIYFDFSGYSDMAIGLGLMFGIRLPLNFLSPYRATNIIDFWRRWHMTLSRFLRDYLYIPLGGGRSGRTRRYLNLMLTMLLGGLWHGAGWTFVIWGGLHGVYLVINHFWRWLWGGSEAQPGGLVGAWLGRLLTFLAVTVAWVFFRAVDLSSSLDILAAMLGFGDVSLPLMLRPYLGGTAVLLETHGVAFAGMAPNGLIKEPFQMVAGLALMAGIVWAAPPTAILLRHFDQDGDWLPAIAHAERKPMVRWYPGVRWGLATGMVLAVCFLSLSRISEFIYFNF